jgi:predicted nuclease of predicted toxin-antitoxin system
MDVLADESVDRPIVDRLRLAGHKVLYIAEIAAGLSDEDVLDQANHDDALLLTADNDFGELVFRQKRVHAGVILIRLFGVSASL